MLGAQIVGSSKLLGAQNCWELKNVGITKMYYKTFPQQKYKRASQMHYAVSDVVLQQEAQV